MHLKSGFMELGKNTEDGEMHVVERSKIRNTVVAGLGTGCNGQRSMSLLSRAGLQKVERL